MSAYDPIARLYDPWSASVVEDICSTSRRRSPRAAPVVELGVGTGRIAIPTAAAGVHVIGVDSSAGMLAVCAQRAERPASPTGSTSAQGDLRAAARDERVPLVTCPFRAFLHLADRRRPARGARAPPAGCCEPGGRFIFDVFAPSREDIEETHGRWIEREPGIDERADWDLARADADALGARRAAARRR